MALRVAYLSHYAELYGANRCLLELVLMARAAQGVEPFVILAADGPMRHALERHGIAHAVVPFSTWMHKQVRMGGPHHRLMQWWRYREQRRARMHKDRAAMVVLKELCRTWKVQLLHANSAVIGIGGPLARALRIPFVWHIRELPFQHYGFTVDVGRGRYQRALRQANAVIAISKAVLDELHNEVGTSLPGHLIMDAVATHAEAATLGQYAEERWLHHTPFTFILVGLFHPSKGQLEAVEALAAVRTQGVDARLILVGGGNSAPVEVRVHQLRMMDHVDMPGFVEDAAPYVRRAHCALTCSRSEAFGRATAEALTSGIPVIGHASGGTPELIEAGTTGLLYTEPAELQAQMLHLATHPEVARSMGQAARAGRTAQRHIEAVAQEVVRVYWAVLARAAP